MMKRLLGVLLLAAACGLMAQDTPLSPAARKNGHNIMTGNNTFRTGFLDAGDVLWAKPFKIGTGAPASGDCDAAGEVGRVYFRSDGAAGVHQYNCANQGGTPAWALVSAASTAVALATNGGNCSAGQFPLGVDASGAAEGCTALPTTVAGTANQIAVSGATGAITISIPNNPTLPGTTSGSFSGPLAGNSSTASALAADGGNCPAGELPRGVDASGAAEGCAPVDLAAEVGSSVLPAANGGVAANHRIRSIGATFGNMNSDAPAISEDLTTCVLARFAGTIQEVTISGNVSGDATVDVRTVAKASWNGIGSTSSIAASAIPALTADITVTDATLTGWTTAVAADTRFCFVLTGAATVGGVDISLKVSVTN